MRKLRLTSVVQTRVRYAPAHCEYCSAATLNCPSNSSASLSSSRSSRPSLSSSSLCAMFWVSNSERLKYVLCYRREKRLCPKLKGLCEILKNPPVSKGLFCSSSTQPKKLFDDRTTRTVSLTLSTH